MAQLRDARVRPQVVVTEVPAPTRLAPYAMALTADVLGAPDEEDAEELASGRFVLLHDPAEPEPWGGPWRVVTFTRAALEPELAHDPVLGSVGWSWLVDALDARGIDYLRPAGTVTRVVSESFADLADKAPSVEMEVRASWSPLDENVGDHFLAWSDLLCTIAGLPPLPEGVVALPGRRR